MAVPTRKMQLWNGSRMRLRTKKASRGGGNRIPHPILKKLRMFHAPGPRNHFRRKEEEREKNAIADMHMHANGGFINRRSAPPPTQPFRRKSRLTDYRPSAKTSTPAMPAAPAMSAPVGFAAGPENKLTVAVPLAVKFDFGGTTTEEEMLGVDDAGGWPSMTEVCLLTAEEVGVVDAGGELLAGVVVGVTEPADGVGAGVAVAAWAEETESKAETKKALASAGRLLNHDGGLPASYAL